MSKIHYRNLRLRINAGIDFPQCQADAELLDMDKARWQTTSKFDEVTCLHCLKLIKRYHHPCKQCKIIGRDGLYDLYFCTQETAPTLIARWSNSAADYIFADHSEHRMIWRPQLQKAYELAKQFGYVKE
jgi:hypothetical protein